MLKTAFSKGLEALTVSAVVKVIVVGVGGLMMSAMSDSIVDDMMKKAKGGKSQ